MKPTVEYLEKKFCIINKGLWHSVNTFISRITLLHSPVACAIYSRFITSIVGGTLKLAVKGCILY